MKRKDHQRLVGVAICAAVFFLFIFAADFTWRFDGHSTGGLKPAEQTRAHAEQMQQTVMIAEPLPLTDGGEIDYSSMTLAPVLVVPKIGRTQAESVYEIVFTPAKTIPVGGRIIISLPAGFGFLPSCQTVHGAPENSDLNGPSAGVVVITSISCGVLGSNIDVTIGGAPIRAGDGTRFFIQGVVNSGEARVPPSQGYLAVIITRDAADIFFEQRTSLPFFLAPAGNRKIFGVLFNDNGAGLFGFAGDGVQSGSEPGLADVEVCLNGASGSQCMKTDANGFYQFTKLTDGYYGVSVMPLSSGTVVGGPFFVDVSLFGEDRAGLNFTFTPSQRMIDVTIHRIPLSTDVEVFAFGAGVDGMGGRVVRTILWNGLATRTVSLPVSDGLWSVGVGQSGAGFSTSFISPPTKTIRISEAGTYSISLTLQSAEHIIRGRVVDGAGVGIPNAFVIARPRVLTGVVGKEVTSLSLFDGSFELKVMPGQYAVDASVLGMPAMPAIGVSIDEQSVMRSNGVVMTSIPFVVAKGERSISGRVLDESGNPLARALVSAEEIDKSGNQIGIFVERPTDATGLFVFFITDGTWRLRAVAQTGGDIPSKTVTVTGKNLADQTMQVSLTNTGTVKGFVTKNEKGVSGALIGVFGLFGGGTTVTDANGQYTLRLPAGAGYSIEVHVQGAGRIAPLDNVTVVAGQTLSDQNFAIQTSGTIVVTIPGVTNALVDARDAGFNGDGTTLNPTPGEYRLTVHPGTYTVSARNPLYGLLGEKHNVVVRSGKTVSVSFSLPSSFAVTGIIYSSTPNCFVNASVYAVDVKNGRVAETTTNAAGVYAFQLSNGSYAITASQQGCVDEGAPTAATVSAGPSVVASRPLTQAAAEVSGAVQLAGINIPMETKVVAQSQSGAVHSTSVVTANTSGNNYTLSLTPGTWTISARADGYESSQHTVNVSAGGKTLNMALSVIPRHVQTERKTTPVTPAKGGVVKNADVGATFAIVLPAGSLGISSESGSVSTKVTTAVVVKTATVEVVGGKGIEITPRDSSGKQITTLIASGSDAIITIPYSKQDVAAVGADETKLMIAVWSDDKQQWTPFATTVDTATATLSGVPPHFSIFAPIMPTSAPAAPATPAQELQTAPGSIVSVPSGIILVQPSLPTVQEKLEHELKEEKTLITLGPTLIEQGPDEQKPLPAQKKTKAIQEKTTQTPTTQKTISIKRPRFPVQHRIVSAQKPLEKDAIVTPETPATEGLFELSIAIDDKSRTVTAESDVRIQGEVIKSADKKEQVILRYIITDANKNIIVERFETLSVAGGISFSKTFHIGTDSLPGFYTVSVEAQYQNKTILSSDTFQIMDRITRSEELIAAASLKRPESQPAVPVFFLLILFTLFVIYGFAHMWYTIKMIGKR